MDKLRIGQKLSSAILLLFLSNLITIITHGTKSSIPLTLGLVVLIIPMLLVKKELHKNILSWILLALSIPTLMDINNDITNMNGFFLFLFSISLSFKSKKIYTLYFSLFIISLLYRFNISYMVPSQIIEYLGGLLFIGIFYQHYIHPKKNITKVIEPEVLPININSEVVKIVLLRIDGYSYHEISDIFNNKFSADRARRKINDEMVKNKLLNREQLTNIIVKSGQKVDISDIRNTV